MRHPQLCIDAVLYGVQHGGRAGIHAEATAFATCASLDVHKALVHIFLAQRQTKKVRRVGGGGLLRMPAGTCTAAPLLTHVPTPSRRSQVSGVTDRGLTPRTFKTVAVLGGGLMGGGIATVLASAGVQVLLKEINAEALAVRRGAGICAAAPG